MNETGLKKEFFNLLAIILLINPLIDCRDDVDGSTKDSRRGDCAMSLCRWKELKDLAIEKEPEFFDVRNFTVETLYGLQIRSQNLEDWKKPLKEIERVMLLEYRDFSLMKNDFSGRPWIDSPLTDRERKLLNELDQGIIHPVAKPSKAIKLLADNGLIEQIPRSEYYRLVKIPKSSKGEWKTKAEKLLVDNKIHANWAQMARDFIRKDKGEPYTERGFLAVIKHW